MSSHLWPARAEYLRRGGVVVATHDDVPLGDAIWPAGQPGVLIHGDVDPCGDVSVGFESDERYCVPLANVHPDLTDVTARGHAVMPYTTATAMGFVTLDSDFAVAVAKAHPDYGLDVAQFIVDLRRMRALDESVTVAEARAALEWAEGVANV